MSHVTIAANHLIFQFSRWRSESYAVRVSPFFAPNDSYDLIAQGILYPTTESWPYFARLLEPRFALLETAFHPQNFPMTKLKLAQLRLGNVRA